MDGGRVGSGGRGRGPWSCSAEAMLAQRWDHVKGKRWWAVTMYTPYHSLALDDFFS